MQISFIGLLTKFSVWDQKLFISINSWPHRRLTDKLGMIIDLWYYAIIGYAVLIGEDWKLLIKILLLAIVINSLLLKRIFKKRRISTVLPQVSVVDKPLPQKLKSADAYGFPSGSAAISMAVAVALMAIDSQTKLAGIAMVGVNGIQRLYTGAHLPSEVIGGWIAGGLTAMVGLRLIGVI